MATDPKPRTWTRRPPPRTGWYWTRTHGGQPVVCWYHKETSTVHLFDGSTFDPRDREFTSTQDCEFLQAPITPPTA